MSDTVSKPGVSKTLVLAIAAFLMLSGLYLYSNYGSALTFPATSDVAATQTESVLTDEVRTKEYAEYKKVFLANLESYKALLAEEDKVAALKSLESDMAKLAAIEVEYIKIRPSATEPEQKKLELMIRDFSATLNHVNEVNYQMGVIRETRLELTNSHILLKLASRAHYEKEKDEIKALLKEVDQKTVKVYESGTLLAEIEQLTTVALTRMKPDDQEATPKMMSEARLHATELHLNRLTAMNAPPKKVEE